MKTLGEKLQTARLSKNLSVTQVAKLTKIQPKFITALEENNYQNLPESAFVKGFITNYAQVLHYPPNQLLAIFRRDFAEDDKGKVVPRGITNPINTSKIAWTPQYTKVLIFVAITTIFFSYLIFQFRLLSGVPNLKITSPQDNQATTTQVLVSGTTNPEATVTINSKPVNISDSGDFSETVSLSEGEHSVTIQSTSRTGKTKTVQRTVIVAN